MASNLTFKWFSYAEAGDQLDQLRRQVFVEEQGLDPQLVSSPYDHHGLHLGVFEDDQLVSAFSAYLHGPDSPWLRELGLPTPSRWALQLTRRAEVARMRGQGTADFLVAAMVKAAYDAIHPLYHFVVLEDEHSHLARYYTQAFGLRPFKVAARGDRQRMILMIHDERAVLDQYCKLRQRMRKLYQERGWRVPSLVAYLDRIQATDFLATKRLVSENLYAHRAVEASERQRLERQGQFLFAAQQSRLDAAPLPAPPARLIDIGTGPGYYLSLLKGHPKLAGYQLTGLESDPALLDLAKESSEDISWIAGNAYDTGLDPDCFDVAHLSFVLIHLRCPDLALRELRRILKPNGLLYVVDINHANFEGPKPIIDLVRKHDMLYEADREILNTLEPLAQELGFHREQVFTTRVSNTASSDVPEFADGEISLSRAQLWAALAFLRDFPATRKGYEAVDEAKVEGELSLHLETHIFRCAK